MPAVVAMCGEHLFHIKNKHKLNASGGAGAAGAAAAANNNYIIYAHVR